MAPWRIPSLLFALLATAAYSTPARGQEPEPAAEAGHAGGEGARHGGHHKLHTQNLLGAKALAIAASHRGYTPAGRPPRLIPHFGASVFYEREVLRDWLEIELNVALLSAPHGVLVPIDLLFKIPFHVSRHVTPYVALGPAVEFLTGGEEAGVFPGSTAALGVYVWFHRHVGVDVEVDYTISLEHHEIVHAPAFGLGPVFHF